MKLRIARKVFSISKRFWGCQYRATTTDRARDRLNRFCYTKWNREDRQDGVIPPFHERHRYDDAESRFPPLPPKFKHLAELKKIKGLLSR